jgi:ribosomal protein L27
MEPCGGEWLKRKIVLFSLTNGWVKYYQVDRHRKTEEMQGEF